MYLTAITPIIIIICYFFAFLPVSSPLSSLTHFFSACCLPPKSRRLFSWIPFHSFSFLFIPSLSCHSFSTLSFLLNSAIPSQFCHSFSILPFLLILFRPFSRMQSGNQERFRQSNHCNGSGSRIYSSVTILLLFVVVTIVGAVVVFCFILSL
jgi:hypothetical protein